MNRTKLTLERVMPYLLIVGGVIGLICSFIISLDKLKILENPSYQPSCDLNPIVSCGSVMRSPQGSFFGFPNPWIGLAAFALIITVGVAIVAGAKFKRWFWQGLYGGIILGLVFAYWLLFESMYRIHALCPYCLTVDVVVITLSWYVLLYLIEKKFLRLPKSKVVQTVAKFCRSHHLDLLLLWFLIIIVFIFHHFWYYFGPHLFHIS